MLYVQVLGKGLIPRGLGLAPRKDFFKADLNLIQTILMTPGLKVNMRNPEDGKIIPVTRENVKKLWDKYRSDRVKPVTTPNIVKKVEETTTVTHVDALESKADSKVDSVSLVVETNPSITPIKETEEPKVEEAKEEPIAIKPIIAPEENKNNQNNNNNNNNRHNKK